MASMCSMGRLGRRVAATLPRYGVTAFCPTTVACGPAALRRTSSRCGTCGSRRAGRSARVLPAHLESNFINPAYPRRAACGLPPQSARGPLVRRDLHGPPHDFTAADILHEIERAAPDVGIVTLAPELDGGLDLIRG